MAFVSEELIHETKPMVDGLVLGMREDEAIRVMVEEFGLDRLFSKSWLKKEDLSEVRFDKSIRRSNFDLVLTFSEERILVRVEGGFFLVTSGDIYSHGEETFEVIRRLGPGAHISGSPQSGIVTYTECGVRIELPSQNNRIVSMGMSYG